MKTAEAKSPAGHSHAARPAESFFQPERAEAFFAEAQGEYASPLQRKPAFFGDGDEPGALQSLQRKLAFFSGEPSLLAAPTPSRPFFASTLIQRRRPEQPGPHAGRSSVQQMQGRVRPTIQRKMKITGLTETERKNFVTRMNDGSPIKFELDDSGLVQQKDSSKKPTNEYSTQMVAAITDPQTVKLDLVPRDETVYVERFEDGKVDYDEMMDMPPKMFRNILLHFVVERFAIPDYEANKAKTLPEDFNKAHKKGHRAQERHLRELYPGKTIEYKGENYDHSSRVVDDKLNGTMDYYFDFTDVRLIMKEKIAGGRRTQAIISSRIEVAR